LRYASLDVPNTEETPKEVVRPFEFQKEILNRNDVLK